MFILIQKRVVSKMFFFSLFHQFIPLVFNEIDQNGCFCYCYQSVYSYTLLNCHLFYGFLREKGYLSKIYKLNKFKGKTRKLDFTGIIS